MWVSEWRIDKDEYGWKISNGGVYSPCRDLETAQSRLHEAILNEKRRYRIGFLSCPACGKTMAQHSGSVSYEMCLIDMALITERRESNVD